MSREIREIVGLLLLFAIPISISVGIVGIYYILNWLVCWLLGI